MNRKKIIRWAKILLLVYCIIGIAIYGLQDYIMFRPVAVDKSHKYDFKIPYREVNLPYSSGVNINVIQFTTADSMPKGLRIVFSWQPPEYFLVREACAYVHEERL